jgi:hypothetical protein
MIHNTITPGPAPASSTAQLLEAMLIQRLLNDPTTLDHARPFQCSPECAFLLDKIRDASRSQCWLNCARQNLAIFAAHELGIAWELAEVTSDFCDSVVELAELATLTPDIARAA